MISPLPYALEDLVEPLEAGRPFALSRWGDGEWSSVLGRQGQNCDRHPYSPELREDLTRVLMDRPSYTMAMQRLALERFGPAIEGWMGERDLSFEWVQAETLARACARGSLDVFLEALRRRQVVLVGPRHLRALDLWGGVQVLVAVPDRNCHEAFQRVRDAAASHARPGAVLLFSAGMSANALIHDLWTQEPEATYIDCGSIWEPYCGRVNRGYHRRVVDRLRSGGR